MYKNSTGTVDEWMRHYGLSPQNILGWRIWYEDGSYYDSRNYHADELKNDGVQVVILYLDWGNGKEYKQVFQGVDTYWLPDATQPKFGKLLKDEQYYKICDNACNMGWTL